MNAWRVIPYNVYGVKLYAIERDGYILRYCDLKIDAQYYVDELNDELDVGSL